jgi:hypothetical protein
MQINILIITLYRGVMSILLNIIDLLGVLDRWLQQIFIVTADYGL